MTSDSHHQAQLSHHSKIGLRWFERQIVCLVQGAIVFLSSIAAISLSGLNTAAQAQAEFGNFGNFGITTPSERFRQEGQDRIEQEIHRLYSPAETEERLTIDNDVNIQEELLQFEDPRWHLQNTPDDDWTSSSMDGKG
jgi:hypothetical protein